MDGIFEGATSLDVCNRGSICRSWLGSWLSESSTCVMSKRRGFIRKLYVVRAYPNCNGEHSFENVMDQVYNREHAVSTLQTARVTR